MSGFGQARLRPARRTVLLGMGMAGISGLLSRVSRPAMAREEAELATLFEEWPDGSAGVLLEGTAVWRVEKAELLPGDPPQTVVRVEVDIPDRPMVMTSTLRRNRDRSLPASHTIDFVFTVRPSDPKRDIRKLSNLVMKESRHARGSPLAGLGLKVTDWFFLMGLSDRDMDVAANVQMLKELPWLALPIVYENDRRATLVFAKGETGTRAIAAAFAEWDNPSPIRNDDRPIGRPRFDVIK